MDGAQSIGTVEKGRGDSPKVSNSDILIYAGPITRAGFEQVVREIPGERRKNVLLVLVTIGGNPHAAYRIARFLRRSYQHFTVFVPGLCKSAGTLLCIGAHEIVMSETGELGPLDVQIQNPDELADYGSGLDVPQALEFLQSKALDTMRRTLVGIVTGGGLSTKRSAEIATDFTVGLYAPIYAQIAPSRLGRNARALSIARQYATKIGGNLAADQALDRLIAGYPSHSYSIDRDEAAELFKRVRSPKPCESELGRGMAASASTPHIAWSRSGDQVHLETEGDTVDEEGHTTSNEAIQPTRLE